MLLKFSRLLSDAAALTFLGFIQDTHEQERSSAKEGKRIVIVGAGTGGIGALWAILSLPEDVRSGWSVSVLEQRKDVGGIW